jgi:hypothetical protein
MRPVTHTFMPWEHFAYLITRQNFCFVFHIYYTLAFVWLVQGQSEDSNIHWIKKNICTEMVLAH